MTRAWDYPGRKHQVIKPAAANGQIATGKMLKPMKSKNDEQVPALGSQEKGSQEQPPVPYDVHTEGPLTYFQFYLDEVVQSANAAEPSEKRQSISKTVLLGTGLVAATVVSGLLIGDALKPTAPPDTKIPPLKPKQRAMVSLPRPTSAAPEKLEAPRFVPPSQRQSQPQVVPQSVSAPYVAPRQNSVDQTTPQSFAPMPSVTLTAVPETLTVSRSLPAKRTITGAPAPAGMKPLVRPTYQELPDLQRPPQSPLNPLPASAIRETLPTKIAAPESINGQSATAPPPVNPSQPSVPPANPAFPIQPSAESAPATPPQAESELTAPNPSVTNPTNPATEPPPLNSTPNAIESKVPNSSVKSVSLTEDRSAIASLPAPSAQLVGSPSRLQDFVTLARSASVAKPRTFMPLTQQAATEAGQYQQLEQFTIRQVASQDYQKEWAASSKSADRFGYPAYGFIDYQRQVIVVLSEQPQVNPVQSQKATLPTS
ncbi:MAG: hypothetical protein DCF22_01875 [Leptolyngbya sp.]|nr:MAG: hypothetical protein DCF22_01875 [Leptolyngbya sp.]